MSERNIRERRVSVNGQLVTRYQVQVRLTDPDGIPIRVKAKSFDTLKDAIAHRDRMRSRAQLGEAGDQLEQRRRLKEITLHDLFEIYLKHEEFLEKRSHKNELVTINAFRRDEARLCKKSLAEITPKDFQDYISRRKKEVKNGTILRELNPIRDMFKVIREDVRLDIPVPNYFKQGEKRIKLPKEEKHDAQILSNDQRLVVYKAILGIDNQGC